MNQRAKANQRRNPKRKRPAKKKENREHVLHARIEALEGFLAGAPAQREAVRARNVDTIAPPESLRRRAMRKVTIGAQALEQKARERRHFFEFMALLSVWLGVVIWLWFSWINPS
ncbi:MAG: hypothetical protein ACI8UO_002786 [Verrucomicrobiales bacterium]|jgi:hypothetical protein